MSTPRLIVLILGTPIVLAALTACAIALIGVRLDKDGRDYAIKITGSLIGFVEAMSRCITPSTEAAKKQSNESESVTASGYEEPLEQGFRPDSPN